MPRSVCTDQQLERMSEEEVITRAKQGCRSATEYLLSKYQGLVEAKSSSFFLLGADREDLIQEGMIGLFKAIRDFSPRSLRGFRSFAALCVTRQIISAVKGASRHKHFALNAYVSMDGSRNESDSSGPLCDAICSEYIHSPESVVLGREFESQVSGEMNRSLSGLERKVLEEYLKGSSYRDIARRLGCNVKQVDNALQRAKKKLEQHVQLAALSGQA